MITKVLTISYRLQELEEVINRNNDRKVEYFNFMTRENPTPAQVLAHTEAYRVLDLQIHNAKREIIELNRQLADLE